MELAYWKIDTIGCFLSTRAGAVFSMALFLFSSYMLQGVNKDLSYVEKHIYRPVFGLHISVFSAHINPSLLSFWFVKLFTCLLIACMCFAGLHYAGVHIKASHFSGKVA
jgi:predicted PurR-regulated permease PerM